MEKTEEVICISIEEYKELLIIKGKYEELKSQPIIPWQQQPYPGTKITYYGTDGKEISPLIEPYKVTCESDD